MQAVSTSAAPAATGLRRVLVVLCATEITSWGILFYAFPVLLGAITTDTGWSPTALTAVFSAGQLLTAATGILVGRRLDRHGPRLVMTAGSVLAVTALLIVATAATLTVFLLGWALAGIAMGAVLYPPAFAALTRWYGPDRVKALTVLTLAGGLASTVFAPLTAALVSRMDWRATYLVLAAILAVVTVPGHWFGLRLPWPDRPEPDTQLVPRAAPGAIARSRTFLALAVALSVTGFASFAVVVTLVPLMTERGISTTTAAIALGLGGVGQVASRIGYSAFAARTSVRTRTTIILAAIAATTTLLGIFTTAAALTIAAVLSGMARGVFTLLQATAITDRWGTTHYGQLTGLLSAPMTIALASAPFAATALASGLGGYPTTFILLGIAAAAAAALSLTTIPTHAPEEQHS
ncbi:MFS transporter [Nocardia farcinica]|uniref:MFS transporter n=1 Tax=Nocardia farcinica TaxID=37329 RepID=UPI00189635D1|nr:MFS transporter [Nocardia farcinica]MBF6253929.1 MFS transporter [Nocardia farcinica]MBF6308099.1 MFS transporter [Nocardia farcinica]MBF6566721.1 MFS transporter [Nocardia farcinica]